MAQFAATIGAFQLEVAYSDIESWLSWSCVIRRDGQVVGSIGGVSDRKPHISDQRVVEDAVGDAIRLKFPFDS